MSDERPIVPTPKAKRVEPYWKEINKIIDPEIGIGLVDLGLIYKIDIDEEKKATIHMTLTSPSCPVGPVLLQQVEDRMRLQPDIANVEVRITWDPPWSQNLIDPDIRAMMFGY